MEKLSKAEFVEYLNFIVNKHKQECKFCDVLEKISDGGGRADVFLYANYETRLINLLTKIMDDKDKWIEYWAWECDYGQRCYRVNAEDISTPERLYDFMVRYYYKEVE